VPSADYVKLNRCCSALMARLHRLAPDVVIDRHLRPALVPGGVICCRKELSLSWKFFSV
jgi:hypothetical protein